MHSCRSLFVILLAFIVSISTGCRRSERPFRKPVIPVSGKVLVDGKIPDTPIQITCHPRKGMDQEHPTISTCLTGPDGTFQVTTYETGDGVPEGEYDVTFVWKTFNMVSGRFQGEDRLSGRYDRPEKSQIHFNAEAGRPVDLGTIELKTK
jgi:hypothetical protein